MAGRCVVVLRRLAVSVVAGEPTAAVASCCGPVERGGLRVGGRRWGRRAGAGAAQTRDAKAQTVSISEYEVRRQNNGSLTWTSRKHR